MRINTIITHDGKLMSTLDGIYVGSCGVNCELYKTHAHASWEYRPNHML